MKKTRFLLFFAVILQLLESACSDSSNKKKFSITTWFTSFEKPDRTDGKTGQKFKYRYEEYNADTNVIYEENFGGTESTNDMWGKLMFRSSTIYDGKQKTETKRQYGLAFPAHERGTVLYNYEYKDDELVKVLQDKKIAQLYSYDAQKNQIEKRVINYLNIPEYTKYYYEGDLKKKEIYYTADTVVSIDSFFYDKAGKMTEKIGFNSRGIKSSHRLIIRNNKELVIREKWRDGFDGWIVRQNGQLNKDEYYEAYKYFYNSRDQLVRKEYYDQDVLRLVYEYEWN